MAHCSSSGERDSISSRCFFCLQDPRQYLKSELPDKILSGPESETVNNLFSLRHLSRFLQIFMEQNDNSTTSSATTSPDLRRKLLHKFANDSMVSVCQKCSGMMKEFTERYHQLEVAKLRLDWCDVMTKAKNDSSELLQSGDEEMEEEEKDDENLLRTLHVKTKDKMTRTVPLPLVVLSRCNSNPYAVSRKRRHYSDSKTTSHSSSSSSKSFPPANINLPIRNLVQLLTSEPISLNSTNDIIKRRENDAELETGTTIIAGVTSTPEAESTSTRDEFVKCSFCRAKFLLNRFGPRLLRQHTLQYHCETYFTNHKLDSVTDEDFKKILADLLFHQLLTSKCAFCPKKFLLPTDCNRHKQRTLNRIRIHFFDSHYAQLERRLLEIQKDPNLPNLLRECESRGKLCACGVYIANLDCVGPHEKHHCTLTQAKDSEKVKARESNLKSHQAEAVLEGLPAKTIAGCIRRRLFPLTKNVKRKARTHPCQSKFPTSCPYCRYECPTSQAASCMGRHLVHFHPQYFFSQVDYPNIPSVVGHISQDQFQRVLQDILFPELISSVGTTLECTFCGQNFTARSNYDNSCSLRKHLINLHHIKLVAKLYGILEDSNLMDKLESVNPVGASCPCGMYLPNGIDYHTNHHDRWQCNLKLTPPETARWI